MPRRTMLAASLLAVSLAAAACGSSSSAGSAGSTATSGTPTSGAATSGAATSNAAAPATIKVGVLPIADVAPLYLANKLGYFAKQNLTVEPTVMSGGAAVASAVLGGSLNFGFAAAVNLILAKEKGLPVQIVANGDSAASNPSSAWSAILVAPHSSITSVKGLKGKTISSNALQGVNELAIDGILAKNGMSPSDVNITVLNFPDMPSALLAGHVDAVSEAEPFVSALKAKGASVISPLFSGYIPGMTVGTWFTTSKEISSNTSVVQRFNTAIAQADSYAESHPAAVRSVIPTYTKISSTAAKGMELPNYANSLNVASIQQQEKLMKKLGWITSNVATSSLIWSGAK